MPYKDIPSYFAFFYLLHLRKSAKFAGDKETTEIRVIKKMRNLQDNKCLSRSSQSSWGLKCIAL